MLCPCAETARLVRLLAASTSSLQMKNQWIPCPPTELFHGDGPIAFCHGCLRPLRALGLGHDLGVGQSWSELG